MGQVIAIANQKGCVGKTTTAVNLAACMAAADRKTLLIDLDPQGNSTQGVGQDKNNLELSTYDTLVNETPMGDAILETGMDNFWLLPANRDLVGAEVELDAIALRMRWRIVAISPGSGSCSTASPSSACRIMARRTRMPSRNGSTSGRTRTLRRCW